MWENLSTALAAILSKNFLTQLENVYEYEASKLDGFPALTITPSASENDYHSTTENRRVYAFTVRVYAQRGSSPADEAKAEKTMRLLVDSVINRLDESSDTLNVAAVDGYTYLFLSAAPARWGYINRESDVRVAEIGVRVHYDVDTTAI